MIKSKNFFLQLYDLVLFPSHIEQPLYNTNIGPKYVYKKV